MGYFPYHSPEDELLSWAESIKNEYNLTDLQLIMALQKVMLYFTECLVDQVSA